MGLIKGRFRFIIAFSAFFCLTAINSNYMTINFTFICMEKDTSDGITNANGTLVSRYDYTPTQKSAIIWAVAAGTILGTWPVNWAYLKFGARLPFFVAGIISVIATAFIPFAASLGYIALLVTRFVQGLAYSSNFGAIGCVVVRWAPLAETGTFIAIMTSFSTMTTTITNPVSGWLCESSLGWRWVYYTHAAAASIFFIVWYIFYKDDPRKHKLVIEKEMEKISKEKSKAHIEGDKYLPYWQIIKNPIILIVWFNALTEMTTITLMMSYSPLYFHEVLGFDVKMTGVLVAVAAATHAPLKFVSGWISDRLTLGSEKLKMCLFNSIAVGLAGLATLLIGAFKHAFHGYAAVACFAAVYITMAANCGGFYKCGSFVARQYAHFVLATIQFMKCVALVTAPASVALFVANEASLEDWSWVFYLNGGLLIFANILFCIFCTDEPAVFTYLTRTNPSLEDARRRHEEVHEKWKCAHQMKSIEEAES